jgi:hypothetical protein
MMIAALKFGLQHGLRILYGTWTLIICTWNFLVWALLTSQVPVDTLITGTTASRIVSGFVILAKVVFV